MWDLKTMNLAKLLYDIIIQNDSIVRIHLAQIWHTSMNKLAVCKDQVDHPNSDKLKSALQIHKNKAHRHKI